MKKRTSVSLVFLLFSSILIAQQNDNVITTDTLVKPNYKKTVYYMLQRSWVANQESSYLSVLPYVSSIGDRRIPLIEGEGAQSNNFLVEANLDLRFPLFYGKKNNSYRQRRNLITFDYNGNFRMTLDDSKPLTPGSNKVGFSWYSSIFNNYTGWLRTINEFDENITLQPDKNLTFYNTLLRIHHYSNGQPVGFFYFPDENDPQTFRNDYTNGDFSTNYIYLEFTKGKYMTSIGSLKQLSLAYRYDFGTEDSVLAYSKEQERSYGRHRVFLKYDYRTMRHTKRYEFHYRAELEYILDDLSAFRPNLINDNKKYRLGLKGLFEIAPKSHRSIGYFVSAYYGRDYLNIRYDDIVYSFQLGVTLSLDKFFMPSL